MPLYVDTSALLKRYIAEPDSDICEQYLLAEPIWISARHTSVEIRRNLSRLLEGEALAQAHEQFTTDWQNINVIELDELTCEIAAEIAEATLARSLDALHLAAAIRVGKDSLRFLTYDIRQAQTARLLGFNIVGSV
ncbi:MAG: type II toxin-antitoxin system VapC family toxin [Deltaproteobacteria bacterium]|nr:type II toxin-antitoxin system VapC family toxin [Deltaproteobacteria bacterium]